MVTLVLAIAILNLGLGYLAAAALAHPVTLGGLRIPLPPLGLRFGKAATALNEEQSPAKTLNEAPAAAVAAGGDAAPAGEPMPGTIAGVEELPGEWLAKLTSAGVVAESFVEGAAQVLRLEVLRYRQRLVAIEIRCRRLIAAADATSLRLLAEDLRALIADWLQTQTTAAEMLAKRSGRHGDHEAAAADLEQALSDQAVEIRGICDQLAAPDSRTGADGGGKLLLEQTSSLLHHAHELRDRMLDLLATLLRTGERLEVLGESSQVDPGTGLANRIAMEALLALWWRGDPERSRTLSAILVGIDRFARLNQRLGTRAGDQTIAAIGRLCHDAMRNEGAFERLALAGSDALLVMLGDTGPHQALAVAERLRQSVEAATFDNEGVEFELTLSCGVIEVSRTDQVREILTRCGAALKYAKRAGRNRCAIDEGRGPQTLEPPQFPVKGQIVRLGNTGPG